MLEAAARRAGWAGRRRREGVGYGIGFARYKNASAYCAVVAEVEGAADIRVRRLVVGGRRRRGDQSGRRGQPDRGRRHPVDQLDAEGGRALRPHAHPSDTWETYPILRFSEVPEVEVEIVARPTEPAMGAGEAAQGPTAAAIANAVFDALGVRVRDLPITRERIIAAMGVSA